MRGPSRRRAPSALRISEAAVLPGSGDYLWFQAWQWLISGRKRAPHNADIWHLRHHAAHLLPQIWHQVQRGTYRLSPMLQVNSSRPGREQDSLVLWSAADAMVLKWAALTVEPQLPVHPACLHLRGGAHRSVRKVAGSLNT